MKHILTPAVVALAAAGMVLGGVGAADAKARTFENCTAMHKGHRLREAVGLTRGLPPDGWAIRSSWHLHLAWRGANCCI